MKTTARISIFFISTLVLLLFAGCKKDVIDPLPALTTTDVSIITESSAKSGGTITSDAGSAISARGVCWSTSVNPTISNSKTTDGIGIGTYISNITGLTSGTSYYVRAYATNSAGTSYGNAITLKTLAAATTITDKDGNTYNTVNIGSQTWMAENLRTTKYRTGEGISIEKDPTAWSTATYSAYCDYNNDPANATKYGKLYNWNAVNDARKIAPVGWHVATSDEWTILISYLGGENAAGAKLKEMGISHWNTPNAGATNESGFTALPGGSRDSFGTFGSIGNNGYWWSATEHNSLTTNADIWYLNNNDNTAQSGYKLKASGYSVRCVKDAY